MLPAVDIAGEISGLGKQRRRHEVEHPAADADAVVEPLGLGRRRRLARIAGQRVLVHVGDVGEIEQVVDDELIVGLDVGCCLGVVAHFGSDSHGMSEIFAVSALAAVTPSRSRPRCSFRAPDSCAPSRLGGSPTGRAPRRIDRSRRTSGRDSRRRERRPADLAAGDSGAARWQQQSSSAPTWPRSLRNSTTLSLRKVLPTGFSLSWCNQYRRIPAVAQEHAWPPCRGSGPDRPKPHAAWMLCQIALVFRLESVGSCIVFGAGSQLLSNSFLGGSAWT